MENWKVKNIIVGVVIFVLIAVIASYKLGYLDRFVGSSTTNTTGTTTNSTTVKSDDGKTLSVSSLEDLTVTDNSSNVGITAPPEPTNGKIKCNSMVGPSGAYNDVVLTDGKNYKVTQTAFTEMLINEEAVSAKDIKAVLQGYIKECWKHVDDKGAVQLVIASSLTGNPKLKEILPELRSAYTVTETTSTLEGAAAFKVAVNPQYYNTAFTMDITPTITRFTYNSGGKLTTLVAQAGSKYYQNGKTKEQALAEIRRVVSQIPQQNRQLCIVLWAASSKYLRDGTARYSGIPAYTGEERFILAGVDLLNEVKTQSGNVVVDYVAHWYSAF